MTRHRSVLSGRRAAALLLAGATALAGALGAASLGAPPAAAVPPSPSTSPSPSPSRPPSPGSSTASSPTPTAPVSPTPSALVPDAPSVTPSASVVTPEAVRPEAAADQPLVVGATTDTTSVSTIGQTVRSTFTVRNAGGASLADLVVEAPGAGLSPVVCAPVMEGGTLAAGATTTCRASRTTTLDDLRQASLVDPVRVSATAPGGQVVTATASCEVGVAVPPPKAPNQHKWVVAHGQPAVFSAASIATPAEPGGPPVDVSRTFFPDAEFYDGKVDDIAVEWTVRPDGSVQVDPVYDGPSEQSLRYRVFDVLGHSITKTLTVTVRASAKSEDLDVSTLQGQPVTFDPLHADSPAQHLDGTSASFVRSSLRLTLDPGAGDRGTVTPDGTSYAVPWVGTYTLTSDKDVTFDPVPQFSTTTSTELSYTAQDTAGSQVSGHVRVHVAAVRPRARAETRATTYGHVVTFAAASDDTPGSSVVPLDRSATALTAPLYPNGTSPAGSTAESKVVVDRAGTWEVQPAGSVRFTPASGYSGTDQVAYVVVDRNGTRSRAALTVAVRPGPVARTDSWATPEGRRIELDVLANDVPGQRDDGTPGSFDASSLRLARSGQPAGSTLSVSRTSLDVPGQGTWSATAGRLVYVPAPGFAGGTTPITYQVTDAAGSVTTALADMEVTSDLPAASNDVATTPFQTPVVVDGSRDDSAGGGSAPGLDYASTAFPADGQPAGSRRAADGTTLAVPGQGSWVLAADGTATFSPVATFVGTTSPVTYSVADLAGQTARATMRAQVRPGPQPRPDVAALTPDEHHQVTLSVLLNDVPSRNADGTLGHTDRRTLRLARTGQPAGWTIEPDGRLATTSTGMRVFVEPENGTVSVSGGYPDSASTGHLVYTVDDLATTASGRTVRHLMSSYFEVDLPTHHPTATPDHEETRSPDPVTLRAARDDVPSDPAIPISLGSLTFPSAQLGRLPAGSTITPYGINWTLTVPGQGSWTTDNVPRLNGISTGTVLFVPDAGFVGDATADYRVFDELGAVSVSTLSVTVRPGYTARPDVARTPQGVSVDVDVTANDDPGQDADGSPAPPSRGVRLLDDDGSESGWPATSAGITRTVAGEGTWRVGYLGTRATFTPLPGFAGAVRPQRILVASDTDATVQVTVDPVAPVARADLASTSVGSPVIVPVVANDAAGVPQVPLVRSSVRLGLEPGLPAGSTLSDDAKRLSVRGRGVFLVAGTGEVTFVPLETATGPVPRIAYSVADANGTSARAPLTVTVRG